MENKKVVIEYNGVQKVGTVEKFHKEKNTYEITIKVKDDGDEVEFDTVNLTEDKIILL